MKIIVFSLGVVFPYKVQGGSQKVLVEIMEGMGNRGHEIEIYCPKREDNCENFYISDSVVIKPILPLKGTFPMPYEVSPFELLETCRIMNESMEGADLLYCHDGGLNIEFLKRKIPTVISLRDFCYTETLLGALNFEQCAIIVNSEHTQRCLYDSFARVNIEIKDKVYKVLNGYDARIFRKCRITESFLKKAGLPPKEGIIIVGYPHRPQVEKGFNEAINVIKKVKQCYPNIRLLIPLYMDQGMSERTDATYQSIYQVIEEEDLQEQIIFHTWLSHENMVEYFSYCDMVLCLGNFVEAFSNVSVEALLCETPVIAVNVATYRTMPIRQYLDLVDYGDTNAAVECVLNIIGTLNDDLGSAKWKEARKYIEKELTIEKCIEQFERIFINAVTMVQGHLYTEEIEKEKQSKQVLYRLSAWCFWTHGRIYDDYKHCYHLDEFNGLFEFKDAIIEENELIAQGIRQETILRAIRKGVLIRVDDI